MLAKMMAVCFGASGFFAVSIYGFLRQGDLFVALKKGGVGLVIFWVIGYLFGLMLTHIIHDICSHNE